MGHTSQKTAEPHLAVIDDRVGSRLVDHPVAAGGVAVRLDAVVARSVSTMSSVGLS